MRTLLACLAAATCIGAAPATPQGPKPSSAARPPALRPLDECARRPILARTTDGRIVFRRDEMRLGTARPVDLYLAVERREDGCSVPLIARRDVYGGNGRPEPRWLHRN